MALESMLVAFAGAICVDIMLGDPSNKFHPVAWLGHFVRYFVPKLKQNNPDTNSKNNINHVENRKERLRSIMFSVLLIVSFGIAIHICAIAIIHTFGYIAFIFLCALTLKMSIAIKGM